MFAAGSTADVTPMQDLNNKVKVFTERLSPGEPHVQANNNQINRI
jgi:hypothetical protein